MGKVKKQTQKQIVSDGLDVEFSQEVADHTDLEAQARANAADQRAKRKNK